MYYGHKNPSAIRQDASAVSDACWRSRERCPDTRSPLYVEILGELAGRCGKINLNVLIHSVLHKCYEAYSQYVANLRHNI